MEAPCVGTTCCPPSPFRPADSYERRAGGVREGRFSSSLLASRGFPDPRCQEQQYCCYFWQLDFELVWSQGADPSARLRFVAVATLEDGTQVDLLKADHTVSWEKPNPLSERFRNSSWHVFMHSLKTPSKLAAGYRPFYVDYLKRQFFLLYQIEEP